MRMIGLSLSGDNGQTTGINFKKLGVITTFRFEFSEGSQVTVQKLDYWISFFVLEIRRQDGQCYPPNSLFNIVAGIQRHLRSLANFCDIAFFNKSSPFLRLRKALDCRMKELTASGIGVSVKRADPISLDDEISLWNSGVLNMSSSKGLSYAVFFYNCKTFGLRGNQEQKNLDASQFTVHCSDENSYVLFNSWNSKTFNGGLDWIIDVLFHAV